MKNYFLTLFFLTIQIFCYGQINIIDSTVNTKPNWKKGDTLRYYVSKSGTRIKGIDTTFNQTRYKIELIILNSNNKGYRIQCRYNEIETSSLDTFSTMLAKLACNSQVIYNTDKNGTFLNVENWQEMQKQMHDNIIFLNNKLKLPESLYPLLSQLEKSFSSKEAIESAAIKDILQLHYFYGYQGKLGYVSNFKNSEPSILGPVPIDYEYSIALQDIDFNNSNYIITSTSIADKDQLSMTIFNYLTDLAKKINKPGPEKELFENVNKSTEISALINDSGWILKCASFSLTSISSDQNIEETIIELK